MSSKTINKTTVPHHTSDYEDQYVVSTKTANKSSEEQPPSDQYDAKKGTQEVSVRYYQLSIPCSYVAMFM